MRLARSIVSAGFAQPEYTFLGEQPIWNAPPLTRLLGVSAHMPHVFIHPRVIFAAEVIGPLSGKSEEDLAQGTSLRRYYEQRDLVNDSKATGQSVESEGQCNGDNDQ